MYLQFFGFSSPPFSDTPDVRLFWQEHCSQTVFKALLQGLTDLTPVQVVIAEPGLGKSVLCRRLLNSLRSHRSRYDAFFMAFPDLPVTEVLANALTTGSSERRNVLIIDEAQALSAASLLELANVCKQLNYPNPALQMILFAQPELDQRLSILTADTEPSAVFKRYELLPLTATQTAAYINNRLLLTGVCPEALVPPELAVLAYRLTGGVPRLVNTLMRKSLLLAYEENSPRLSVDHLQLAAASTAAAMTDAAY